MRAGSRIRTLIGNLSFVLVSNLLTLLISTITVLILPKLYGEDQFGYCSLYILYVAYTGVFQLGWCDGTYLRMGGMNYKDIKKGLLASQFWSLMALNSIVTIVAGIALGLTSTDPVVRNIFLFSALSGCLSVPRTYLYYVFQATNKIKEYANNLMLDRVIFGVLLAAALLFYEYSFTYYVYADLIAKAITLLILVIPHSKDLLRGFADAKENIKEIFTNMRVGIKLMIANFASIFIVGIIRISIENFWGIKAFARVSLTMSVSNLLLVFIGAIAIVAFPILRRVDEAMLQKIYQIMDVLLMMLLFILLLSYYPLRVLLELWLPQYAESLKYMAILFPLCLYESKMSLLSNTYLKTLRRENKLLQINVITVILSFLLTVITVYWLKNLDLTVASIVLLLAFRSTYASISLSRILGIPIFRQVVVDNLLALSFVLFSWFISGILGFVCYAVCLVIYILIQKSKVFLSFREMKQILLLYNN